MNTFLSILHVLVCIFLVLFILVQQGKGGGMGAALGGGGASAQVFGGRGAGNFLTRSTAVLAALFMLNCVAIAYFTTDRSLSDRQAQEKKDREKKGANGSARAKDPEGAAPSAAPAPAPVPAPAPAGSTH